MWYALDRKAPSAMVRMLGLTVATAAGGALVFAASPVLAQPVAAALSVSAATLSGRISDARRLPIAGAVITARGTAVGWTATLHDGSFTLAIPPGSYEILVRKAGYTPTTLPLVATAGRIYSVALELDEANLRSVGTNPGHAAGGAPFNAGVGATATLPASALAGRPGPSLRDVVLELPGVTLAHPADSVPDSSFVVRGGTIETRVQIDGHPVSAGATGRWNSSYAALPIFDSVEIAKGVGLSGANAGESAFGTVNLRTRDFAAGRHADITIGADDYGGSYSAFAVTGSAFAQDRLSYVLVHGVANDNGPGSHATAYNGISEPDGRALIAGRASLNAPLTLGGDVVKLRWRLGSATSLSAGYVGVNGAYAQSGGAYATYLGDRTIVGSAPDALGGTIVGAPQFAGLVGKTVPIFTLPYDTTVRTSAPLFEAELRTTIKNDTLLVRPYAGTIFHTIDGRGYSNGDLSGGGKFSTVTTGAACSVRVPCFVAESGSAPFRDEERDRLHGTTVTLVHPLGDATLSLSYDHRSDATWVASGDPSIHFDGSAVSATAYQTDLPATEARNDDWSATYALALTRRLRLTAGLYSTGAKVEYGSIAYAPNVDTGGVRRVITRGAAHYAHNDPHLGLVWHPARDTSVRLSAGSAITVPYANLLAGPVEATGVFSGGRIGFKNRDLQPETTFAYNLGVDERLHNGAVLSADLFDATVHGVFASRIDPFDPGVFGVPAESPYSNVFATMSRPVNAPIERNYGLELHLDNEPAAGLGYRFATTFQRAYVAGLTPAVVGVRSPLVNGDQLSGSTAVPYAQGYFEFNYRNRSGIGGSLGATYTGPNNWTNGPAFTVWSSMLRYDLRGGYRIQLSIANLFDARTGNIDAAGTALPVRASTSFGSALSDLAPMYGASAGTRFGIAPRTFRLQFGVQLGS